MKYTEKQAEAIYHYHHPGNVLVSASAGSGKTLVLVNRVIYWLLSNPTHDIDHLLIVTFTRAAAKEMQDRIRSALQEKIEQSTDQVQINHLITQLRKVPIAHISTLDSFCQWLVTHYYYVTGFDPHFRVLNDTTEVGMLRDRVWQDVREDRYAHDPHFDALVRNFTGTQPDSDDDLTNLVYRLYDYANVKADPQRWLASLTKLYQVKRPFTESFFYQHDLLTVLQDQCHQMVLNFKAAKQLADAQQLNKEAACLQHDLKWATHLIADLRTTSWDSLRKMLLNYHFGSFPRLNKKKENDQQQKTHQRVLDLRNQGKTALKKLLKFFSLDEQDNVKIIRQAGQLVNELVQVVYQFSDAYRQLKTTRHAVEFVDLEHEALRILQSRRNGGVIVRDDLRRQFTEIMVDEYQDNNRLQDAILSTIAKHNDHHQTINLFMVGDVKQSIYRFRLADPKMFLVKQSVYQKPQNDAHLIQLAANFRSTQNIDRFINLIFDQIMDSRVGHIAYYPQNCLHYGAKYYSANAKVINVPVHVLIYDSASRNDGQVNQLGHNSDEPVNPQFRIDNSAQGQIEIIAQKIKQIVDNHRYQIYDRHSKKLRRIRYSDIALISATRNNDLVISDIFKAHQIPVAIEGAQSYFKTTEIQIMMSLLRIIDNPYQDIPLVAVLRSPIVGLNENQLAYLRINSRTNDYYQAVKKFVKYYGTKDYANGQTASYGDQIYSQLKSFLNQLDYFRDVAKQHNLVDLIWTIYQKTGFLDYVGGMPAGEQRQANLHALYERASSYEKGSFQGLFQFVRFIQRMQDQDNDLAESIANQDPQAVSVITIHGSKGLEFPVVFFYDVAHDFNQRAYLGSAIIDDEGLGINYYNPHKYMTFQTLPKQVITQHKEQHSLAEEMRKMYVALTRAEQRLYIVGATKNYKTKLTTVQKWQKDANTDQRILPRSARVNAKNYLDWLGAALYRHPDFQNNLKNGQFYQILKDNSARFTVQFVTYNQIMQHVPQGANEDHPNWLSDFRKRVSKITPPKDALQIHHLMNFKYPNWQATQKAAYQSVSEIKQLFADPDDNEMARYNFGKESDRGQLTNQYMIDDLATPRFMQSTNAKPSATTVGTATHLVFQMLPLTLPVNNALVDQVIKKLVNERMIDKSVAPLINRSGILAFFKSPIGEQILQHPTDYHREQPFSLLVDAKRIFPDLQNDPMNQVLVHGIIDGFLNYRESGQQHIILVDYKTDYVDFRHPELDIQKIKARYRGQLNLYSLALRKILGCPIYHKYLYLVNTRKFVRI